MEVQLNKEDFLYLIRGIVPPLDKNLEKENIIITRSAGENII